LKPRFQPLRVIETRRFYLSEPLRLAPSDHPRIASIRLAWNASGRLLKFFFRLPEVRIVASTTAGRVLNARVPPEVMQDGVPDFLPIDMIAARALFASEWADRLDTLSFSGPGAHYLEPVVRAEIYEASDATLPRVSAVTDLARLQNRGPVDTWRIELLNDTGAGAFSEVTVPDTRGYVRVQGWAILSGGPAGGIILELDGKPYPAEYGKPRADVGALFHLPGAPACGFEWSVPVWNLGKTSHELRVKILTPDRTAYHDGGRRLRFRME
jgi:hypothetical protein